MKIVVLLTLIVFLGGCRVIENLRQGQAEIVQPNGAAEIISPPPPGMTETIEPNGTVFIEPHPDAECFARARHFTGLVQKSCSDIAHETRP